MKRMLIGWGLITASTALAQTDIALSGKVLDGNNNPVALVEVELESLGLRDTTDAQGVWAMNSTIAGVQAKSARLLDAAFQEGMLEIKLDQAEFVSAEVLDASGTRLSVLGGQWVAAGSHRIDLSGMLPHGQYFVRIWAGESNRTFTVHYPVPSQQFSTQPLTAAATITDKLVYRLQGQVLTTDQISKYQQYIEKFLQIRNVSGLFSSGIGTIDKVYATFAGGAMPLPVTLRLGWLASTNTYTGNVYTVRPLGADVYNYTVFAHGVDSLNHKSTVSPILPFDSYAGDLVLQDAVLGNAYPSLKINVPVDLAMNDTLRVSLSDSDSFGGKIVERQVRFNGGSWQNAMNGSFKSTTPVLGGRYFVEAKVMDDDSNWTSAQKHIDVQGSGASLKDLRDGKVYKTTMIGDQLWMAENLAYVPAGKDGNGAWCYNNSADSCAKYGRLYDWSTAMNGSSSSTATPSGIQGICPSGWHLPSDAEWTELSDFLGGESEAAAKLKSAVWEGGDRFSFSALPGGSRNNAGSFYSVGAATIFWSTSENTPTNAWYRNIKSNDAVLYRNFYSTKEYGFAIRCLAD